MPSNNNLDSFWNQPTASAQKDDYQMALFQPMSFSQINFPHYQWNWNAPQFTSHWADYHPPQLRRPSLPRSISFKRHTSAATTITPVFDIRETATHYFLDGEFAGARNKDDISIHWTGQRTLEITATIFPTDVEKEWGIELPSPSTSPAPATAHPAKEGETQDDQTQQPNTGNDTTLPKTEEEDEAEEDLSLHRCLSHDECRDEYHRRRNSERPPTNDTDKTLRSNSDASHSSSSSSSSSRNGNGSKGPSSPIASLKKHFSWSVANSSSRPKSFLRRGSSSQKQSTTGTTTAATATSPSASNAAQDPALRSWTKERHTGTLQRILTFPEDVDQDSMKARLEAGVLKMIVTKKEPLKEVKSVKVDILPSMPKPTGLSVPVAGYFSD